MSSRWKKRTVKTRKDCFPCQKEKGALAWDRPLCLGQWQGTRKDLWQPREIQQRGKESRKKYVTPQVKCPVGARSGSLFLCYTRALAGRRKRRISGSRRRPKLTLWKKTVGKLRRRAR